MLRLLLSVTNLQAESYATWRDGLLRARCERKTSRTTEKRDELAPSIEPPLDVKACTLATGGE